jgi:proteasome alpha subunit
VTMPIYASPEQFMRDRSDYARKGIARGRSVVVTIFSGGVLFVAENPSPTLHKVSEIYDRMGFAATGRYNEFENLRTAGIRLADVRGFSYDRRDVNGRWLANAYAQTLGSIFSEHSKPLEVELCVAEVGWPDSAADGSADQLYRITYDGSIFDEPRFAVMGGVTEPVSASLEASYLDGWDLPAALRACVQALGTGADAATSRQIEPGLLEVAVLDRRLFGRTFRRVEGPSLMAMLATTAPAGDEQQAQHGGPPEPPESGVGDTAAQSVPEAQREPNVHQRDDSPDPTPGDHRTDDQGRAGDPDGGPG